MKPLLVIFRQDILCLLKSSLLIVGVIAAGLSLSASAYADKIESETELETRLSASQNEDKIPILAELVWQYRNNRYEQAFYYGSQGLELLKSFPDKLLEVKILHSMAWAHMRAGNYDQSIKLARSALKIATAQNDKKGQAYALNVLGAVDWFQGSFLQALDHFLSTLALRIEIGDKLDIARSYNNIGSVYQEISDYPKALEYHLNSLRMMQDIDNQYGEATSYFNIGIVNQKLGDEEQERIYLEKALASFAKLNDAAALAEVQINLGYLNLKQEQLNKAQSFFQKSLIASQELKNKSLYARAELGLATIAFNKDEVELALKQAEASLKTANSLGEKTQLRDIYELLSKIYQAQGNDKKALTAFQQHHDNKDAILSNVYEGKLSLLQQKFDAQQAKNTIAYLEREKALSDLRTRQALRETRYLTIGFVMIIFFVAVITYQYFKLLKKNRQTYLLSITDSLCNCYNRNYLFSVLIPKVVAEKKETYVLLLDLDRFKDVNDRYGHDVGDKLLAAFCCRIKKFISDNSYLIRLGGEEFVILGQDKTESQAMELAERIIRQTSQSPFEVGQINPLDITCSIGVSLGVTDSENALVDLIKQGDLAMYQAKRQGRNRVISGFR